MTSISTTTTATVGIGNESARVPPPVPPKKSLHIHDTDFSQQRIQGWEPIINFKTTWKLFIGIGILFIFLGLLLMLLSSAQNEIRVTYTGTSECTTCMNNLRVNRGRCKTCKASISSTEDDCTCTLPFEVHKDIKTPVYVYYELANFHQNHRSYVKSRDDFQLLGKIMDAKGTEASEPNSQCNPFNKDPEDKIYFPCGAMANAMFSDDLAINKANKGPLMISTKGIVWDNEKFYKYKNPRGVLPNNYMMANTPALKFFSQRFVKPKDWSLNTWKNWWEGGGLENPRFINWMHPAATPTFRKLYGIIESVPVCTKNNKVLCKGIYNLVVTYRFDVDRFNGGKSLILATTSSIGAPNPFIGWFSFVLGLVTGFVGVLFMILSKRQDLRVYPQAELRSNPAPDPPKASKPTIPLPKYNNVPLPATPSRALRRSLQPSSHALRQHE